MAASYQVERASINKTINYCTNTTSCMGNLFRPTVGKHTRVSTSASMLAFCLTVEAVSTHFRQGMMKKLLFKVYFRSDIASQSSTKKKLVKLVVDRDSPALRRLLILWVITKISNVVRRCHLISVLHHSYKT